jgi:hypothetical protein
MKRVIITAGLKRLKHGNYKAQCGQPTCLAPLGEARAPSASGVSVAWLDTPINTPDGRASDQRRDWLLRPPRNPEQSVARGFRRDVEDGQVIYHLIKPQPKREAHGRVARDERGQPVPRQGGRRPIEPLEWQTWEEIGNGLRGFINVGEKPVLPAVVVCGDCGRWNRVKIPDERTAG